MMCVLSIQLNPNSISFKSPSSLLRSQRDAEDARTEVEVLKRQLPLLPAPSTEPRGGSGKDAPALAGTMMDMQRQLAAREVTANVARDAKEAAEVDAARLQAALDECRREVIGCGCVGEGIRGLVGRHT